jgi:hypothetical protein
MRGWRRGVGNALDELTVGKMPNVEVLVMMITPRDISISYVSTKYDVRLRFCCLGRGEKKGRVSEILHCK